MPIHARKNLYNGVNAHLHSHLQHEVGGWKVFHNKHISDLAEALDQQLPAGYEVGLTKSLQIVEIHPDTGERLRRPEPDVTVYRMSGQVQSAAPYGGVVPAPTQTLPALATLEYDEEAFLTALMIYRWEGDDREGLPVLRIELLSPTNKPPGDGYLQYREKRNAAVESGVPLVEIDYLHETRSPIRNVPSYPDRQQGAHPYLIAITDPRPLPEQGEARIYGFSVDAPIPTLPLPLAGDAVLVFDFDAVYQRTYASLSYFSNRVDYAQLPEAFDTYSPDDQARIRQRMTAVGAEQGE